MDSAFSIEQQVLPGSGTASATDGQLPVDGHLAAERELAEAAGLLAAERYEEAAAEYDRLAAEHPALVAECAAQAGTALAALGQWREAAERYAAARDAGADPAAMDDRIWAACKGLEVEAASLYERLCPDGVHAAEAGRLAPSAVHEPGGEAKIFDAAAEALTRLGLRFSVITGEPRFLVPGLGNHAQYISHLSVDEDRCFVLFYTMCPLMAPEHKRPAIAELLTRANYGMSLGNFELDLRDGEIRYKTSIDVEGSRLTEALLAPLVYANRSTMDRYMPAIIDVLYQGGDPAMAAEAVERTQEE